MQKFAASHYKLLELMRQIALATSVHACRRRPRCRRRRTISGQLSDHLRATITLGTQGSSATGDRTMKSSTYPWTRRRILRGMMAGGAVTVGLPLFDCLLNGDNNARHSPTPVAPLPTRFATWFWALGLGGRRLAAEERRHAITSYSPQLAVLNPFKKKLNLFSGSRGISLMRQSNSTHFTGVQGYMTGKVSNGGEYFNSVNTIIGDVIGGRTRFRSLEVACDGDPKDVVGPRARRRLKAAVRDLTECALHPDIWSGVRRSELGHVRARPKGHGAAQCPLGRIRPARGPDQAAGICGSPAPRLLLHVATLA